MNGCIFHQYTDNAYLLKSTLKSGIVCNFFSVYIYLGITDDLQLTSQTTKA